MRRIYSNPEEAAAGIATDLLAWFLLGHLNARKELAGIDQSNLMSQASLGAIGASYRCRVAGFKS